MADLCDRCGETDDEMEYGDCAGCSGHYCIECLLPTMHDCEGDGDGPSYPIEDEEGRHEQDN